MNPFYNAVYLSPHLDDAALSCGGQIYDLTARGESALVVTVMAGDPAAGLSSPFAESLHQRWKLQSGAVQARRSEDIAACLVLGTEWQHWDFLDCIYRVDPQTKQPLYTSEEAIFGQIDLAEIPLVDRLAGQLTLLPPHERLYVPLTLGRHVDHQLTRQAAERAFPGRSLFYYEDYPYARQFSAVDFAVRQPGAWQSQVIAVSEKGVAARIEAVKCFESQVSTFFKDDTDLAQQLRSFVESVGGERVWTTVQD